MSEEKKSEVGKIIKIGEIEVFPSGFSKRELIIETTGDYPQPIKFELMKDKCNLTDKHAVGNMVRVYYNLNGREYQGMYFVNLTAWRLSASEFGEQDDVCKQQPTTTYAENTSTKEEDVPF